MELHVDLKLDEMLLDINIKDIHQKKTDFNGQSLEQILHNMTIKIDENTEIPIFKHICRKWMMDASVVRYQVAVQRQMEETAKKHIKQLKNTLIKKYGNSVNRHFVENNYWRKQKAQHGQKINTTNNKRTDEIDDPEIVDRIKDNKKGNVYGKVMLTGMYLLQLNETETNHTPPKAMLINTADSNDSMSGISTASKSTQGSIKQDKEVNGRELTCESVQLHEKGKIVKCCAKYDIKFHELTDWIKNNIQNPNDDIHKWDYKQLQEKIAYEQWKVIISAIKAERYKRHQETNEVKKEFDDPELDAILSRIPSSELLESSNNDKLLSQASPLLSETLSYNPSHGDDKNRCVESGRQ